MGTENTGDENTSDPIEVEVSVPTPDPEPEAEPVVNTTVIETGSEGVDPTVMEQLIEQQRVNAELQEQINSLTSAQIATDAAVAAVAEVAEGAEVAAVAAVETVAENEQAANEAENDREPRKRTHPYWRNIAGSDE